MSLPADFHGATTAASIVGCSLRTLYRFVAGGVLPAYKPCGKLRFKVDEIDDFIQASKVVREDDCYVDIE